MVAEELIDTGESVEIDSTDGVRLVAVLNQGNPTHEQANDCSVLFLHGFPSGEIGSDRIGSDLPRLGQQVSAELGWRALTVFFRGCGQSTGNFSLQGWVADVKSSIEYLDSISPDSDLWLVGFGTGGAVGLVAAAESERVAGVVVAGSPADFEDWATDPESLLRHAREVGAVSSSRFPSDIDQWSQELLAVRADAAAEVLAPRPLLVLHGTNDEAVPHFDARIVADRHGSADLRVINGGYHYLRSDPRAVAIMLGWLDRQALERTSS